MDEIIDDLALDDKAHRECIKCALYAVAYRNGALVSYESVQKIIFTW